MLLRVLQGALAICSGATFAAGALSQAPPTAPDMTGWNRVGELRNGQPIIVSTGSGLPAHCIFRGITDHSVLCDQGAFLLGINHREISRDEVAWLRTDNAPRDRAILMGVSGGALAALGAANSALGDTASERADSALIGGLLGVSIGAIASVPITLSMPGKTIYMQPGPPSAAHSAHLRWPALKKRPAPPSEPAPAQ
jgi:hypothetical protein